MYNQFYRYEEDFSNWRRDGMPGLSDDSFRYVDSLTSPDDDQAPRDGTLWPHQWESFLRVVYSHEIIGKTEIGAEGLLLNVVTGGGKTAVIAAVIAWLRIAHKVQKFVLICPNLIVRDRLEDDFDKGKVFKDRDLLPDWSNARQQDFPLTTLGSGKEGGWADLLSANVILGNIHQFYQSNKSGQSNLSALMNGPDFAVFVDEAHNSPAEEFDATLKMMREKVLLRIDTTATPDRADGQTPDSDMIYEYDVNDALADGIIKTPVVYQPDIKTVELTYTDARTGEQRKVEEIDWSEVDRRGLNATQWVTDDEPMRQQMAIALRRLEEQERRAKGRYQPILFVVAVCKADAAKAEQTLNKYFRVKTLMVTEDSDEEDRQMARELGRQKKSKKPYRAVVSVMMLREGWDVPEVGVILLLRKFGSKVYGQQVVGRGLRRVRVKGVEPTEPQICAIVDHPKLEHQWLWDIFNAKKRVGVKIDETFIETEDLPEPPPKQEQTKKEFIIDLPPKDPEAMDNPDFSEATNVDEPPKPLENWREVLKAIVYDPTLIEITKVNIESVIGQELKDGWKTIQSPPDAPDYKYAESAVSDEQVREAIREKLLSISEVLCVEAGCAAIFKDRVYSALLRHIRDKFLEDPSGGFAFAERQELNYVWKMLDQVYSKVGSVPGLIAGVVQYVD